MALGWQALINRRRQILATGINQFKLEVRVHAAVGKPCSCRQQLWCAYNANPNVTLLSTRIPQSSVETAANMIKDEQLPRRTFQLGAWTE